MAAPINPASNTSVASAVSIPTSVPGTSSPPKRSRASRRPTSSLTAWLRTPSSRTSTPVLLGEVLIMFLPVKAGRPGRGAPLGDFSADVRCAGVALGGDALLAYVARHRLLVGDDVLLQPHALLRDRALLDHRLLLGEDHLVLLVADLRAARRPVDIRVGDRLALDPRRFPSHGHGLRLGLGFHVL